MTYPVTLTESLAVVGVIDPDAYAAATDVLTEAIDMGNFTQLIAILSVGDIEDTATVDFSIQQSATSGGSYTDITGKSADQLVTANDDKQVVINLDSSEVGSEKPFVKVRLEVGTAAADAGVIVLGGDARYDPASDLDVGSVIQTIK